MYWHDRYTYVCIPCRFTSKYSGRCPTCRGTLRAMYNFQPPRKRDDREWKKVELSVLVVNSNLQLCGWTCCVPISSDFKWLTLSQYKARIRKRRTHRQGGVPRVRYQYK